MRRNVRSIRQAIAPRFAMRTLSNMKVAAGRPASCASARVVPAGVGEFQPGGAVLIRISIGVGL